MPRAHPNLRRIRYARGLTTAQLGQRTGIPEGTIRNIENGTNTASMIKLHRIAAALCVDVSEVVADQDDTEQAAV